MNLFRRVHRDQQGSMSIVSMFALLILVFLLGLVMNTGRQVDQKVKLQNAADAVAWSGGVVMVRSINTLAYTNHLLADTFALTAFMGEARDRNAESYVQAILDHWSRIGPFLATSPFPPFAELGQAIQEKLPYEQQMATTFSLLALVYLEDAPVRYVHVKHGCPCTVKGEEAKASHNGQSIRLLCQGAEALGTHQGDSLAVLGSHQ